MVAAYYDPNANGGLGVYWDYPTGNDSASTPVASGTLAGTAVYEQELLSGYADITEAGGLSPYGAMAMGGNAYEWQETASERPNIIGSAQRLVRGGDFGSESHWMTASVAGTPGGGISLFPQLNLWGFRVASVPEPSGFVLAMWVAGFASLVRRRGIA